MSRESESLLSGANGPSLDACGNPISRRAFVQGSIGAASALLAQRVCAAATSTPAPEAKPAKAKAIIQIWMWGGPPHVDTFDPKPESGSDYTGPLNHPIATNVKGIRIGESLPELAKLADKFSILRSVTHRQNGHETASYLTQTGRMPDRNVYPMVGGVVSLFKGYDHGYEGLIPPYIVLTQPQGRFSEAGFLGVKYKPFATGGNPNDAKFAVEGVISPGISDEKQQQRRELLKRLNTLGRAVPNDPAMTLADEAEKGAYDLILGDAGKVFDLSQEKDDLRARYGRNTFGQSCLVARRLIEAGVRYVTINYGGWDTHKDHFPIMRRKLPELDNGFASLLRDLSDRGLLDSTIVWWTGEFGRTPKVAPESPWNGGRHHFGNCFSMVVAGGGFKGGMVVGESDRRGEEPKERPIYPCDLIGTLYELMGIDPEGTLPHPQGLPLRVTPTEADGVKMGGRLKEIT